MRNYVIINGVNSNTITGLAINELPPISKPPLRTLIEEIDGRDGDLITELGYGAYDKVMTIGLYHTFDIDQIIAFFNGTGTIVFSNEPDKKYNFKIIEQIDYESLIKFRTASITLHCQPFKYPLSETPIEAEYKYITETGTNITLNNTKQAKMTIDLKGNTSQYSTTGKNLFDKSSVTNNKRLDNTGKAVHLASSDDDYYVSSYIQVSSNTQYTKNSPIADAYHRVAFYTNENENSFISKSEDNTFTTPNNAVYLRFCGLKTELDTTQLEKGSTATDYEIFTGGSPAPSPTYPQDIHVVSGDNTINVYGENIFNGNIEDGGWGQTVGETLAKVYSATQERCVNKMEVLPNTTYSFMLNGKPIEENARYIFADNNNIILSSIATTGGIITTPNNCKYLVFHSTALKTNYGANLPNPTIAITTSYPITLDTLELCKIGTYQDYIYKEDDKWYLHKEIGKQLFNGTETGNWTKSTSGGLTRFASPIISSAIQTSSRNIIVSNYYRYLSSGNEIGGGFIYGGQLFAYPNQDITDEAGFRTWLSTHNTIVYYVLSTPTNTEITDQNLLNQLNTILYSYNGQTNVSQSNNDEAFIMTITAETIDSGVATINNVGNIYSKPTIDIEGNGTVNVSLNNNQIFSVNVTDEVIIDSTNLEAYKPDGTLQNRQVTGNIANLKLNTGNNTMTFSGDLTKATITDYTRYL